MIDGRVRLLLVEDDEDDFLLTRDMLAEITGMAYTLDWVATYEAAQETIGRREHDVYLLDYRLGAHSGLELVREIAAANRQAPSILLTGHGDRSVDIEAMDGGATDYLIKRDLTPALLERAVRYALQHARLEADLKAAHDRMAMLALHDGLTGLPNRMLFEDRLEQALAGAKRAGGQVSLLLIDLDDFKAINDTFGHDAGDLLLQEVATRLTSAVRGSDTVARQGGDEFAVLLHGASEAGAIRVANKIRAVLAQPIPLGTRRGRIGASIGIAVYPDHAVNTSRLKVCADLAMYAIKGSGGGYSVYGPGQEGLDQAAPTIVDDWLRALTNNELLLQYQPIVTCQTGRIERVEVFVCWLHPQLGLITADRCGALADQMGRTTALTMWVLEQALRQCQAWQQRGLFLGLVVQLPSRILEEPQFPDLIATLLRGYQVLPEKLTLEIAEKALLTQPDAHLAMLDTLAGHGVRLSIAGFGTGSLSIARLQQLPLQGLKLDRDVLFGLDSAKRVTLLSCLVGIGAALGIQVIAEGVQTQAAWDMMHNQGCSALQGPAVSEPRSAADLEQWLRDTWPQ
jgi:diguanylate cyclase (GGDEF)-like protein